MIKISGISFMLFILSSAMYSTSNDNDIDSGIGYLISEFDEHLGTEEYCDDYIQAAENLVEDLEDELEDLEEDDRSERIKIEAELEEAKNARDFIAIFGDCHGDAGCKKGFFQMVSRFGCNINQVGDFPNCATIYEIKKNGYKSWVYIIANKKTSQVIYSYSTSSTEGNATMGSRGVPVHTIHNNFESKANSISIQSLKCVGTNFFLGEDNCWSN